MLNQYDEKDILAEVRSVKHFLKYLTALFTDGITHKSRRMLHDEWTPLVEQE